MHARQILTLKPHPQCLHLNTCRSSPEHLSGVELLLREHIIVVADPPGTSNHKAPPGPANLHDWSSSTSESLPVRQFWLNAVLKDFASDWFYCHLFRPTHTSRPNMSQRSLVSLSNISLVVTLSLALALSVKLASGYAVPQICNRSWVRAPCWRCGRNIVRTDDCLSASICYDGRVVNTVKCTKGLVYSMQARTCIWPSDTRWNDCGHTLPRKPLDFISSTKLPTTPIYQPTHKPTHARTQSPTHAPTLWPTPAPTRRPTRSPTPKWTYAPTTKSTYSPSTTTTTHRASTAGPALPGACGVKAELFIVGGELTDEGEWPWQLSINHYFSSTDTFRHTCGGALINDQWMLTAAHCVSSEEFLYNIIANAYNLFLVSGNEIRVGVSKIIRHPEYEDNPLYLNYPNDIALVKFSDKIELDVVTPICLPGPDMTFSNPDDCWVAGWGDTRGTGAKQVLNDLKVQFTNITYCKEVWGEDLILPTHMCVGDGFDGACLGDSGGPLMCRKGGRYFVAGVTSWGHGSCRIRGFPNVYTRTSDYTDWIIKTIESN